MNDDSPVSMLKKYFKLFKYEYNKTETCLLLVNIFDLLELIWKSVNWINFGFYQKKKNVD